MSNTAKLRFAVFSFCLSLLLAVGCTSPIKTSVQFPDADSLTSRKSLDSVYHMLDSIDPNNLSRANQAEYYYLKMVCADGLLGEIPFIEGLKSSAQYYMNRGDKQKAAKSLFYLGMGYWHNSDYLSVISALNQSLMYQSEETPSDLLAFTHYYLSRLYSDQGYNKEALEHSRKSCEVGRKINGFKGMHSMYSRTAIVFAQMKEKDSAMFYYNQALKVALSYKDSLIISDCYNNKGVALMDNGLYAEALDNLDLSQRYGQRGLCNNYYNKSLCYANTWQLDSACAYAMKSAQMARSIQQQSRFYSVMYQIQRDRGLYQSACAYQDSFVVSKDSIEKLSLHDDVEGLLRQYQKELHKKEMEITQKLSIAGILLVIFLAIAIVLGIAFWNNRKSILLQQKLEALNIEIRNKNRELKSSQEALQHTRPEASIPAVAHDAAVDSATTTDQVAETASASMVNNASTGATTDKSDLHALYLQQLALCAQLFKQKPAFETLRKLRFREDHGYMTDVERKPLLDAIVEAFVDVLQGMLQEFPDLTNDECLYAILSYLGCTNTMMSAITKTSEETLRKRKSRIKQKVSAQVFEFVFKK